MGVSFDNDERRSCLAKFFGAVMASNYPRNLGQPQENFRKKSPEKCEIEIIFENYAKLTKCISKLVFSTVFKYFEVLRMIVFLPFFVLIRGFLKLHPFFFVLHVIMEKPYLLT